MEELIPTLQQLFAMFLNQLAGPGDFVSTKAVAAFQPNRFEPELRLAVVAFEMRVRGLVSVTSEEEKPEWPNSQYSWHTSIVRQAASGSNSHCQLTYRPAFVTLITSYFF